MAVFATFIKPKRVIARGQATVATFAKTPLTIVWTHHANTMARVRPVPPDIRVIVPIRAGPGPPAPKMSTNAQTVFVKMVPRAPIPMVAIHVLVPLGGKASIATKMSTNAPPTLAYTEHAQTPEPIVIHVPVTLDGKAPTATKILTNAPMELARTVFVQTPMVATPVPAAHPGGLAITVTKMPTIVTPTPASTVHAPTQGPSAIRAPVQTDFRVQTVTNAKQVKDLTVHTVWAVSGHSLTMSRPTRRRVRRKRALKGLVSRQTVVGNPMAAIARNVPAGLSHQLVPANA